MGGFIFVFLSKSRENLKVILWAEGGGVALMVNTLHALGSIFTTKKKKKGKTDH